MAHRILIADPMDRAGLDVLEQSGAEVRTVKPEERKQLPEILADYDALVVRSSTKVTADLLRAGKRLKVVGRAGIGVDNVDVAAATEAGVLVVNAPTANLLSATEHTFALLLALARRVPAADAAMKRQDWDRKSFTGYELQQKRLGIIGFGRIGQAVAARARAFEMEVAAFDPFLDASVARRVDVKLLPLAELLAWADVVTLHVPLTDDTRDLLGATELAQMKPGALLVNCARGGVVDEAALLAALESGHLGGAAVDVFAEEPPTDWRLATHPKVVSTPHIGAQTVEAQERISLETTRMVLAALDGSLAVSAVNLPFRPAGAHGEPFLRLAEQLGRLAGSLLGGRVNHETEPQARANVGAGRPARGATSINRLRVDLWGIEDALGVPVSVAALKGVLTCFLGEAVNYVNAEKVAAQRGIEVVRAAHAEAGDYPHLVRVTAGGEQGEIDVAGTLFSQRDARVVSFRGFRLEFRPEGRLLVLQNHDVPGVVGRLGTILGDAGINIAEIHLARMADGGDAMAVLQLDALPSNETIARIEALPEIQSVRLAELR